ncbi:unnamed protein product [Effrenium voratum]|uniref:Uncharacterized protein n=1 Tax=Effrenium voratum TaxID=2562239 RepID=A0AA36HWB6_9DINO|nr:unnamed protein product [Effrenium voratum]
MSEVTRETEPSAGMASGPERPSELEERPEHERPDATRPRQPQVMEQSRSVPTIPSRYTVTLFKGNREYKGFNSRALRFQTHPEEGPGPGSYNKQKGFYQVLSDRSQLLQEFTERPSWGARGTSGFASKARRFGLRSMPSMPPPGLGCPGPGAYDAMKALQKAKEQKNFSTAGASAAFNPKAFSPKVEKAGQLPGPGQYEPRTLAREAAAAQAAFRSCSERLKGSSESEQPGPGDYESGARPVGYIPEYHQGLDMRYPTFKERSKPRIAKVHQDLPAASSKARRILGDFGDEVSRECCGFGPGMMPGPGHYRQELLDKSTAAVCASAFRDGPKRTDWAPEELAKLPGPGKYEASKAVNGWLTSAKSAFESSSERGKLQFPSAPGPAYYSPQLPKMQKSFRLKSGGFVL